jgi:hypothetical protein
MNRKTEEAEKRWWWKSAAKGEMERKRIRVERGVGGGGIRN